MWSPVAARFLATLAAGALAGYTATLVLMLLSIDSLVFFPSRELVATPDAAGMRYDELALSTADAETLGAWYVYAKSAAEGQAPGVVLFCHGNAGNITTRIQSLRLLAKLGFDVLIFDYRGYGKSSGRPSEAGVYRDVEAAYQYLRNTRGIAADRIVVMGRSLCGAVAVWLASQHPVAGLLVESTFTNLGEVGAHHYPFLPARLLAGSKFDSLSRIAIIRIPKLMAHSPHDEVIPYALGQTLYQAAPQPKRFLELQGTHNETVPATGDPYISAVRAFLTEVLPPR